ncbi:DnaJ domain-containing protein [Mesorhizobium sp. NBSH29]|uniref:DnaJ domain-containing protein n=1 Tax=Mesorhizobium sp. NBSH29 TaxID=2654249 RepID=UPI00189666EC|nr:DnaJ domain-containing protein [Mesorhizobium sp. NBSH29]QPC87638.1 DnaJ domain-containing protein [Mesorhizobium sp. NBSH29]
MTVIFSILGGLLLLVALANGFLRATPAQLAGGLRLAGPVIVALLGIGLMLLGRAAIGGGLISMALAWYSSSRMRRSAKRTPGQNSTVRTAALEMELDHDSGVLEGIVLAGKHEGRALNSMSEEELKGLGAELASDPESQQLVETYLDGRFPLWRKHAEPNDSDGQSVAPASGAMTKKEAYQVLGLEAGASTTEIRKAHRRLMQRVHPDLGGTSFLATRINEAKDILLSDHN